MAGSRGLTPSLLYEILKVADDLTRRGMTMGIVVREVSDDLGGASRIVFVERGRVMQDSAAGLLQGFSCRPETK